MSFLARLLGEKKRTAEIAKNRLSLLIAHERTGNSSADADFLPALQNELLEVISKYVNVKPDDLKVELDRHDNMEVLEVSIVLPEHTNR